MFDNTYTSTTSHESHSINNVWVCFVITHFCYTGQMQIDYNCNRSAAQLPANVVCWGPLFLWKHNSVTGMGWRHNGQGREEGGFLYRVNLSMAELLSFRSIEKAKWKSEKRQAENGEEYGEGLGKLWEGRRTWEWEWEMQNRLNGNKKECVCWILLPRLRNQYAVWEG